MVISCHLFYLRPRGNLGITGDSACATSSPESYIYVTILLVPWHYENEWSFESTGSEDSSLGEHSIRDTSAGYLYKLILECVL